MAVDWNKYVGLPFKHLGLDPKTGIDCLNLVRLIYKEELNIEFPYTTRDWCDVISQNWYDSTHIDPFKKGAVAEYGWESIKEPELFSVITMYMGTSTITNHCALYIGDNKILHIFIGHRSHIATYGKYYKQYTMGVYKWIGLSS